MQKSFIELYTGLSGFVPITRWLPVYPYRKNLAADVIASICDAVVATPESITYANIAGLPGVSGLYAVSIGPIAYAIMGSSPQLVTGPTNVLSMLTLSTMPTTWGGAPIPQMSASYVLVAALLAFTTGLIQVAMSMLNAGALTQLISLPVISGFVSGSAFLSIANQSATLLGITKCGKPNAAGLNGYACTFTQAMTNIANNSSNIHWQPCVYSLLSIAFLLTWKSTLRRHLPGRWSLLSNLAPLVLMIIGAAITWGFKSTIAASFISLVGPQTTGLPHIEWPSPPLPATSGDIVALVLAALPMAAVSYVESLSIAVTVARQCGPYTIEPNQEMLAVGVTNVLVGLTGGYPVTGSFSRTAVNSSSGNRSGLSSLLSSMWIFIILATLLPALALVPSLVLASIIAVALARLVDGSAALRIWRTDTLDFVVYVLTFAVTIFVSVPMGLLAGIVSAGVVAFVRSLRAKSPVTVYRWEPVSDLDNASAATTMPATKHFTSSSSSDGGSGVGEHAAPIPLADDGAGAGGAHALRISVVDGSTDNGHDEEDAIDAGLAMSWGLARHSSIRVPLSVPGNAWRRLSPAASSSSPAAAAAARSPAPTLALASAATQSSSVTHLTASTHAHFGGGVVAAASGFTVLPQQHSSAAGLTAALRVRPDTVLSLRFGPDLLYLHADRFRSHYEEAVRCYAVSVVIVDMVTVADADSSGLSVLYATALHAARQKGVVTVLCNLEPRVLGLLLRHVKAGGEAIKRVDAGACGAHHQQQREQGRKLGSRGGIAAATSGVVAHDEDGSAGDAGAGDNTGSDDMVVLSAGVLMLTDTLSDALMLAASLSAWAVREFDTPTIPLSSSSQSPSSSPDTLHPLSTRVPSSDTDDAEGGGTVAVHAPMQSSVSSSHFGHGAGAPSHAPASMVSTRSSVALISTVPSENDLTAAAAAAASPVTGSAVNSISALPEQPPATSPVAPATRSSSSTLEPSIASLAITSTVLGVLHVVHARSAPRQSGLFSSALSQSPGGLLGVTGTSDEEARCIAERDPAAPSWLSRRITAPASSSGSTHGNTRSDGSSSSAVSAMTRRPRSTLAASSLLSGVEGIPLSATYRRVEQARMAREPRVRGQQLQLAQQAHDMGLSPAAATASAAEDTTANTTYSSGGGEGDVSLLERLTDRRDPPSVTAAAALLRSKQRQGGRRSPSASPTASCLNCSSASSCGDSSSTTTAADAGAGAHADVEDAQQQRQRDHMLELVGHVSSSTDTAATTAAVAVTASAHTSISVHTPTTSTSNSHTVHSVRAATSTSHTAGLEEDSTMLSKALWSPVVACAYVVAAAVDLRRSLASDQPMLKHA